MDKIIDLTLNRDFRKTSSSGINPRLKINSPTDSEIQCGFATGTLDEIKTKRRIISIHHATEGDKPECLRCGTSIIYGDDMTCKKCNDDFENEKLESDKSFYFKNTIKNNDTEKDIIKNLFNLR